ncbi:MAG: Gfo/Idh/MocA family oxidoreductase [Planctomycetota bacterium]
MRVGICGYGSSASGMHVPRIVESSFLELAAVYDPTPSQREAAGKLPGVTVYDDYGRMLREAGVELVVIVAPSNLHAPLAVQALDAGKHVVTDKPMALNADEARTMIAARDRAGKTLSIYQNRRWDADYRFVRDAIASGELGEVFSIESRITDFGTYEGYAVKGFRPRWRLERKYGGGILYDWGSHQIDQVLHLLGELPGSVYGRLESRMWSQEVDDFYSAVLSFDRTRVVLEGSHISRYAPPRWCVVGSKGTLVIEFWGRGDTRPRIYRELAGVQGMWQGEGPVTGMGQLEAWRPFYEALETALQGKGPAPVSAEDGLRTAIVMDAVRESASTGRAVELPANA